MKCTAKVSIFNTKTGQSVIWTDKSTLLSKASCQQISNYYTLK